MDPSSETAAKTTAVPDEDQGVGSSNLPPPTNIPATWTPLWLAEQMAVDLAIKPLERVLEPSAGRGVLAEAARGWGAAVTCVELNSSMVNRLRRLGFMVLHRDFLRLEPPNLLWDGVLINPPKNGADHVLHALRFLRPGGRMVGLLHRSEFVRMRDALPEGAWSSLTHAPLPAKTFKIADRYCPAVTFRLVRAGR